MQGWEPSLQCCSSPSPATSGRRTNGTISFVLYSFFHLCFLLHFLLNVFLLYLFPLYYFPVIPFFPYFLSPHSLSSSCFFLLSLLCSFLSLSSLLRVYFLSMLTFVLPTSNFLIPLAVLTFACHSLIAFPSPVFPFLSSLLFSTIPFARHYSSSCVFLLY